MNLNVKERKIGKCKECKESKECGRHSAGTKRKS